MLIGYGVSSKVGYNTLMKAFEEEGYTWASKHLPTEIHYADVWTEDNIIIADTFNRTIAKVPSTNAVILDSFKMWRSATNGLG